MLTADFFDSIRSSLFSGSLNPTQVGMLNALDKAWSQYGNGIVAAEAYVCATVFNELSASLISRAENLDYSAERAHQVWPSKFKTVTDAEPYAHNPIAFANHVYASINGNHDEASGDGWKFRGRGPSQITGRANYMKFSQILGLDLINHPDLALDQETGAAILVIGMVRGLFTGKKLSDYFGRIDVTDDPVHARAIVNGDVAANGQKIAGYWSKFLAALKASAGVTAIQNDVQRTLPLSPEPRPVVTPAPPPVVFSAPTPKKLNPLETIAMNFSWLTIILNFLPSIQAIEQDIEQEVKILASTDDGRTKIKQTVAVLQDILKRIDAALPNSVSGT